MVTLVRIHTVNPLDMDKCNGAWTHGIYPLRLSFGFKIEGAWVNTQRNLFFWIIGYEGTLQEYEARHMEYSAHPDRIASEYPAFMAKSEDIWSTPVVPLDSNRESLEATRTLQLRIFTINPRHMDNFLGPWQEQVRPLRERYGFRTEGAWVSNETIQLESAQTSAGRRNYFFWLMSYNGSPKAFEARDKEYLDAQERAAIQPDTRPFIAKAEISFLTSILPDE